MPVLVIPDVPADTAPHAITIMAKGTGAPTCTMIHVAGLSAEPCVVSDGSMSIMLEAVNAKQGACAGTSSLGLSQLGGACTPRNARP